MSEPAHIEPHLASAAASAPAGAGRALALARDRGARAPWLASAVFFFHLGSYGLWEPDEARYAEIAREMLAARNFIVPHLNYVAYIEKPPLLYWLGAMWMALFGVNEFAARLTPALAALAGVAMTWLFVRRTMGRGRALLAGAILTTSTLYAVMAQVLTTDMLLAAAITVALFALYLHWSEGGRWCWLGYAAIAMGLLAKGPVAAAIPILALAIFLWWQGELRGAIGRFHALAGGAMVAADRRAMVHRDRDPRARFRRFLFHRRASAPFLRVQLQPRRALLLLPAGAGGRDDAVDADGAVHRVARAPAHAGGALLYRRRQRS